MRCAILEVQQITGQRWNYELQRELDQLFQLPSIILRAVQIQHMQSSLDHTILPGLRQYDNTMMPSEVVTTWELKRGSSIGCWNDLNRLLLENTGWGVINLFSALVMLLGHKLTKAELENTTAIMSTELTDGDEAYTLNNAEELKFSDPNFLTDTVCIYPCHLIFYISL